jgi:hypothetical protein
MYVGIPADPMRLRGADSTDENNSMTRFPLLREISKKRSTRDPCTSVTWSVIRGRAAAVMVDVGLRAESAGPVRVAVKI